MQDLEPDGPTFELDVPSTAALEQGYRRAYRDFYRWGSIARGARAHGTVAAGLSGSGRYRYGGVRDFLIGVRFVDGQGRLVRGGGKVVFY